MNCWSSPANNCPSVDDNNFSAAVSILGDDNCFNVNSQTNPDAVRFRSVYNDVTAYIIPDSSASLPTQGVLISSIGEVLDTQRKVEVIKSNPFVPLPFDYVLYSKSEDVPLSN